ncbi:MAG: hypothetical protein EXR07_17310 [Acetobacteraceae bacterium]|nr:hypothetical protein [Acetobacteraceae bacterium]
MTRKGAARKVDRTYGDGRLRMARAYLSAARAEYLVADDGDIGNPIISQIAIAAIAFTAALTAKYSGLANQQNHATAVPALRGALGNRFPKAQEPRLRNILNEKDEVQYGTRLKTKGEAAKLLTQLGEFAVWAETELKRPR